MKAVKLSEDFEADKLSVDFAREDIDVYKRQDCDTSVHNNIPLKVRIA